MTLSLPYILSVKKVVDCQDWDARTRFLQLGIASINFVLDHPAHYRLLDDQWRGIRNSQEFIRRICERVEIILSAKKTPETDT